MKKILVPCDFSKPAVQAFRYALDIAAKSPNGIVHALYVVEIPVISDTMLMPIIPFENGLLQEIKQKTLLQFAKLNDKYNKESIKTAIEVQFGRPSEMIQSFVEKNGIDIIIMGSHGAKGSKELFIGSNAERVVRNSSVPVIVLKDYFKGAINNIVFPNTLETENQEPLIQRVKILQNFFKAHLHIVWINTPINFTPDTVTLARLNAFAKRFQFRDYSTSVFNHLSPEEGIIDFANTVDRSLIAMGTHGRKGLAHIMHGSLTESLVNHTEKIVWSYVNKNND
jgi:nucleotide-binding universal stress UspA family protein